MSRRKQSNPKPLKISAECPSVPQFNNKGESNDENSKDNDHEEVNGSESEIKDETKNESEEKDSNGEPEVKRMKIKQETEELKVEDDGNQNGCHSPDEEILQNSKILSTNQALSGSPNSMMEGLLSHLQLPSDVLHLKRIEVNMDNSPTYGWVVCSGIPLPKGSSLGPFQGEIISTEKVKMGDLILQFCSSGGKQAFVNVSNQSGAWLTLLRQSSDTSCCNTHVHLDGGRIWCQIEADLDIGSELIASFTFLAEGEDGNNKSPGSSSIEESPISPQDSKVTQPIITQSSSKPTPASGHAALIFGCPFCGVRFSSPRTLEGHISFYCSRKPESDSKQESPREGGNNVKVEPMMEDEGERGRERSLKRPADEDSDSSHDAPAPKFPRPEQISYQCTSCSYTADKISSLNRHRRIHNRPQSSHSPQPAPTSAGAADTYCQECNIQFSSFNTFKAHKEYYCSQRGNKVLKNLEIRTDQHMSDDSSQASMSPQILSAEQHRLLSPRGHHLLSPKARIPVGGTVPSPLLAEQTVIYTPVLGTDGKPNMLPTVIVQPGIPIPKLPEPTTPPSTSKSTPITKNRSASSPLDSTTSATEEQPLDLSTTKPEKIKVKSEKTSSAEVKSERISPSSDASSKPMSPPKTISSSNHMLSALLPSAFISNVMPNFFPFALSPGSVPGLPAPGVSKCVECNIVFYKRENYLIHKQHYCSGKKAASKTSPPLSTTTASATAVAASAGDVAGKQKSSETISKPSTSSSMVHQNGSASPVEDIIYRYFCVPCRIKFSSANNLTAHKEFYCPHGKDSKKTIVLHPSEESSPPVKPEVESPTEIQCNQCENTFASLRLLKLHICSSDKSKMSFLRCAHCDYVTQTETRMTDHMKVHAPTRSFRCTICGYRGNTIRGMRMHGKTHIDNGEEFTDDNMLEYREPPLVPIDSNGHNVACPLDVESELLRIKNEPYKRRRSRKSFEKSENMGLQIQQCSVCGEKFANSNFLSLHMKSHNVSATSKPRLECELCDFVAKSIKDLACHQTLHDSVNDSGQENTDPNSTPSPVPPPSPPKLLSIKEEVIDRDYERAHAARSSPSSPAEEFRDGNHPKSLPPVKKETGDTATTTLSESSSPSRPKSSDSTHSTVAKREVTAEGEITPPATTISVLPYGFIIPTSSSVTPCRPIPEDHPPTLSQGPKYCRNCDISFTYLSSFLAHKKYYCSAKPVEKVSPSASA